MADIIVAILGKISEILVPPIFRQCGYIVHFRGNVETLQNELVTLGNLKDTVQQEVNVAIKNVETIVKNVETWLDHVSSVEGEARKIVDKARLSRGFLNKLNIKSRHALGRRAIKMTQDIVELQKKGIFAKVSLPAPPIPYVVPTSTTLDSREVILNDIIKNLKEEDINMVGICGMGGVGKTTMVEKVLKRVMEENMFDDYAQTVVSQKADTTKVQSDIAEMLGLKLEENSQNARASRLNQRLEGKKVLIILDDVWERFDLRALGITLQDGQRRCKIVFTSRTQRLWLEFRGRRRELSLDTLPYNESWILFKEKNEGFLDENPDFVPIAKQIVEECAGLPLALVTLGSLLLWQDKHAWNDTLTKLRTKSGMDETVNVCLRQSYDHLGNEEAKSLLLLCSLFEEDSSIYVESLVSMGMGLRLFNGINSIEAARDRVFTLVGRLQSRHLVFANSEHRESIKIHDLVRDVLISIAREKGALVLEHGDTLEKSQGECFPENSIWISVISKEVREFPLRLQFPRLELLRCSNKDLQIADNCFEGMVKLRVVDIVCTTLLKLPSSLQSLTSLHMLCLRKCKLEDLTAIKYLQSLEFLHISDKDIEELPKEIGHLTNLMLLDMSVCEKLRRILPGIISGLTNLEELYLGGLEIDWGAEENEQGRNASLEEFNSLSNLHILHIMIKNPKMLPRTPPFGNLKKYQIQIGNVESHSVTGKEKEFILKSQNYERIISISHVALEKKFNFLLHNSEALLLMGNSTESLVSELVREASQSIKCLEIRETETPEYLVNAMDLTKSPFLVSTLESLTLYGVNNLQQIINAPLVSGNFAKLKEISVENCGQIRNIFRLSTAVDIVHLEKIDIGKCRSMKEVISWEGREEEAIRKLQFPKLKKLTIDDVPLVSFCKGANEIIFHQLEGLILSELPEVECIISVPGENPLTSIFPLKVSFSSLNKMDLNRLKNMKEIWGGQLQAGSFCNLSQLFIYECDSLQYVFSACMAKYLVHLHTLTIEHCDGLTEIIKGPLVAESLVKLKELTVTRCNQLRNTFQLSTAVDILQHLEVLCVQNCGSMEEIISWKEERQDVTSKLQFPELTSLRINRVENLICFCKGANQIEFDQLYYLYLGRVPAVECLVSISNETPLKSFFPHKVSFPSLNKMELNRLENMKEIWCGQLQAGSFCNLSQLFIYDCGSLQYVFSACMAKYLVHLHSLNIWDCDGLTEIIKGPLVAESLVKLKQLTVKRCNQLRNTFQLSTAVDILHLETLTVENCVSMEEIISWEGERQKDVTSKLQFPELTSLRINRVENLICFCKGANQIEFDQLYYLHLIGIPGAECVTSISDETPLKSIFPFKVSFPKLVEMELNNLNNMKEIWCGQPQAGSFYNLSKLIIEGCDSLEYVFSPCMASYLVHLRILYIRRCRNLKEVVAIKKEVDGQKKEDYTSSSILPKLEYVWLSGLQALERFCHIADDLEFPELNDVRIKDCPEFKTFAPGNTLWKGNLNSTIQHIHEDVSFPRLNKMNLLGLKNMKEIWCGQLHDGFFYNLSQLEISECGSLQYVFSAYMAKHLVHLHTLYVWNCDGLTEIVKGPLVVGSLVKLKELRVNGCNQLRNTFQLSTAVDILHHLEELHVQNCGSMEEIISWEGERQKDVTSKLQFPELISLHIDCVENLICFCKGANEIKFHQLYNLTLRSVLAVECVISISEETPLKSIFPLKVSFPKLGEMELWNLKNMKEIWCGQPQAGSFYNLSELNIEGCDSLEYVFSPCMASYLVHLRKLIIRGCRSLKEAVAIKKENYTSSSILPKLEYVWLSGLQALERFCHIADDLEFPELNYVCIKYCPEFKTFAPGIVHTPKLEHVNMIGRSWRVENTLWKGNLNSTIQHIHEDQLQQQKKQEEVSKEKEEQEQKDDLQQRRRKKLEDEKYGENENDANEDS